MKTNQRTITLALALNSVHSAVYVDNPQFDPHTSLPRHDTVCRSAGRSESGVGGADGVMGLDD